MHFCMTPSLGCTTFVSPSTLLSLLFLRPSSRQIFRPLKAEKLYGKESSKSAAQVPLIRQTSPSPAFSPTFPCQRLFCRHLIHHHCKTFIIIFITINCQRQRRHHTPGMEQKTYSTCWGWADRSLCVFVHWQVAGRFAWVWWLLHPRLQGEAVPGGPPTTTKR